MVLNRPDGTPFTRQPHRGGEGSAEYQQSTTRFGLPLRVPNWPKPTPKGGRDDFLLSSDIGGCGENLGLAFETDALGMSNIRSTSDRNATQT